MAYELLYLVITIFHIVNSAKQDGSGTVQYVRRHGSFWLNCSTSKRLFAELSPVLEIRFSKRVTRTRDVPLFFQLESKEGPPDIFVHNINKSRLLSVGWGTVYVSDARPEDSGLYTCTVEKTIGEDLTVEEITNVNVIVPPPRPVARTNRHVSIIGQPVRLSCSARTSYLGPYEFTWCKVNGSLNLTKHHLDRPNGQLELLKPRLDDSGYYFCTLTTLAGVSTSNNVAITIKPADNVIPLCLAAAIIVVTMIAFGALCMRRTKLSNKGGYNGKSAEVECLFEGPIIKHHPQYKLIADKSKTRDDKPHVNCDSPYCIVGKWRHQMAQAPVFLCNSTHESLPGSNMVIIDGATGQEHPRNDQLILSPPPTMQQYCTVEPV